MRNYVFTLDAQIFRLLSNFLAEVMVYLSCGLVYVTRLSDGDVGKHGANCSEQNIFVQRGCTVFAQRGGDQTHEKC